MSGATATATPPAQAPAKAAPAKNMLDEVMAATEDMRAILGKRWGIPPSRIFAYGESFIALAKNCPEGFRVSGETIAQFLQLAAEHDLNPARYEIRAFFDYNKGLSTFVMIDGWLTLANRQPAFDGFEFEYERDNQSGLVAVTCVIHRKDRTRPTKTRCKLSEWRVATSPQWGGKPEWMLEQKALKQGIRRTFGFAGIIDDDDARQMGLDVPEQPKPQPTTTLDQLAPAAPPPADEYSRPTAAPSMRQQEAEPTNGNGHEAAPAPDAKAAARAKLEAPAERPSTGSGQAKPEPAKEAKPEPKDDEPLVADVLTRDEKVFVRANKKGGVFAKVSQMADFDMEDARSAAMADIDDPASTRDEKQHAMGVIVLLEEEAARRAGATAKA